MTTWLDAMLIVARRSLVQRPIVVCDFSTQFISRWHKKVTADNDNVKSSVNND